MKAQITWSDDFTVGVDVLDREHHEIIRIINVILQSPENEPHSEAVSETLGDLVGYARRHLRTEEGFLRNCAYAQLDQQRQDHKEYLFERPRCAVWPSIRCRAIDPRSSSSSAHGRYDTFSRMIADLLWTSG